VPKLCPQHEKIIQKYPTKTKFDDLVKSLKRRISVIPANPGSSPGQAPEASYFKYLKILWTPVFGELSRAVSTGVTTFYEFIKFRVNI
jgi:hypothetical protein